MKKKNNESKLVIIMIIALIAFGIGVAVGVNTAINGVDTHENTTNIENVTDEMIGSDDTGCNNITNDTSNLNYLYLMEVNECIKR